jgi:hypothetical protein
VIELLYSYFVTLHDQDMEFAVHSEFPVELCRTPFSAQDDDEAGQIGLGLKPEAVTVAVNEPACARPPMVISRSKMERRASRSRRSAVQRTGIFPVFNRVILAAVERDASVARSIGAASCRRHLRKIVCPELPGAGGGVS